MSLYSRRGVSAQKEEVHQATASLDKGLYPFAFCRIYSDFLGKDKDWVNLMHADGAGTKSILAYLYWKETGDISVWRDIAQDAVAMNLDDLLCVGIYDNLLFSSTIDRNKKRIPGEVLEAIIQGTQLFFDELKMSGIHIQYLGGETADVGDLVRTIAVNGTMTARWPKSRIVTNEKIAAGDLIVALSSSGRANYEEKYNSGIGSNGLTSARHDVLSEMYGVAYPESFDPGLEKEVVYIGSHKLTDEIKTEKGDTLSIGQLLLSPTRTYAPVIKAVLENHFDQIHGMIHSSGGGQTKCLKYLPRPLKIIKDHLFDPPAVFQVIQQSSGADDREMYQVFNMGQRLEIFTDPNSATALINLIQSFGVEARVIGRVEAAAKKELLIDTGNNQIGY
ncbi:MAG TPA: AIR synthase related protein [Puia sp.]|jgi:phosphoribosylformylglycinamidine cyclo-ligase